MGVSHPAALTLLSPTFLLVNLNDSPPTVFQNFSIKVRVYLLNQGNPWLLPSSSKKSISGTHQRLADSRRQPAGGSDSRVSVLRVKNGYLFIFAVKYTSHKICSFNHQWH